MKILILGASGMLGHTLAQSDWPEDWEIAASVRDKDVPEGLKATRLIDVHTGVEALDETSIEKCLNDANPDFVINCIGIVKQSPLADDPEVANRVNAMLPRQIAEFVGARGKRMVHISTDCVFSGNRGMYTETCDPDPVDLYGKTKLAGEVSSVGATTLRTSFIGRELRHRFGLLEWALSQRGKAVNGFTKAIFSGLTTIEMARVVKRVASSDHDLSGVWHLSSAPISKYELLRLIDECFDLGMTITPTEDVACDRSLNSDRFRERTGYSPPSWREMVDDLAKS